MTLDDIEKAFLGMGAAAVAGLMALVRNGDVKRIEAIEVRQRELEQNAIDGQDRLSDEIHALRSKVDANHNQLVTLLLENRKL